MDMLISARFVRSNFARDIIIATPGLTDDEARIAKLLIGGLPQMNFCAS